jgi:hypothetical protein
MPPIDRGGRLGRARRAPPGQGRVRESLEARGRRPRTMRRADAETAGSGIARPSGALEEARARTPRARTLKGGISRLRSSVRRLRRTIRARLARCPLSAGVGGRGIVFACAIDEFSRPVGAVRRSSNSVLIWRAKWTSDPILEGPEGQKPVNRNVFSVDGKVRTHVFHEKSDFFVIFFFRAQ